MSPEPFVGAILVAVEEADARRTLCALLEAHRYTVLEAKDAADALGLVRTFEGQVEAVLRKPLDLDLLLEHVERHARLVTARHHA